MVIRLVAFYTIPQTYSNFYGNDCPDLSSFDRSLCNHESFEKQFKANGATRFTTVTDVDGLWPEGHARADPGS